MAEGFWDGINFAANNWPQKPLIHKSPMAVPHLAKGPAPHRQPCRNAVRKPKKSKSHRLSSDMDWSSQVLGGGGSGPGLISDDDDSLCLLIFFLLAGSSTGPGAGREAIDGDRRLERLLGLLGLADFRGAGREAIDGARRLELLERRLDLLGLADFGGSTAVTFFSARDRGGHRHGCGKTCPSPSQPQSPLNLHHLPQP